MPDIVIVLVILLVIVLIWRGPKVLPEWGAALGRGVREARSNATKGLDENKPAELRDASLDAQPPVATRTDTTNAPRS